VDACDAKPEPRQVVLKEENLIAHARLGARVYGSKAAVASVDHLRWKYLGNPDGPAHAVVWEVNQEIVARVVALPQRFFSCEGSWNGAFVVDFVVDPAYRTSGLLVSVAKSLARFSEFDFLYMVPNAVGLKFWRGLAKLHPAFAVRTSALPLAPASLLDAFSPRPGMAAILDSAWRYWAKWGFKMLAAASRVISEPVQASDARLDNVVTMVEPDRYIGTRRHRSFLRWRFSSDEFRKSNIVLFSDNKGCLGYAAWRDVVFDKISARVLLDSVVSPRASSLQRAGMVSHLGLMPAGKTVQLLLTIERDLRKSGYLPVSWPFVKVPDTLLPQSVSAFVLFPKGEPPAGFLVSSLSFTLADCDMF